MKRTLWAIEFPEGFRESFYPHYIGYTRRAVIAEIVGQYADDWKALYRQGFRAVKVRVVWA